MANPKTKTDSRSQRTAARRPLLPVPSRKPAAPTLDGLRAQLLGSVAEHYPQADLEPIGRAFDLAVDAHEGQTRATGELFVTHPIASAQIVADLGIDPVAVQAALLHDVPEDTEYSLADLDE